MKLDNIEAPAPSLQKLRQKLRERLCLNNIHNEFSLIVNMNHHMEIDLSNFMKIDILNHLSRQQLKNLIQGISFLKYEKRGNQQHQIVRFQYQNANRQILVTGIKRQFIQEMINRFNNHSKKYNEHQQSKPSAKIIASNTYWITIETLTEEIAAQVKKFLRSEKHTMDYKLITVDYKIERRRIRIVIVKEDTFTLLVDAMSEYKADLFQKSFQLLQSTTIQKKKSFDLTISGIDPRKFTIIYRPLLYNNLQCYSRNQNKEEELSDGFSESNSLNSDAFDSNKMKDIIETSDQGIQSQNSTVVMNEQTQNFNSIPSNLSSPSQGCQSQKSQNIITEQMEQTQIQIDNQIILKSQIIRCDAQEFGLDLMLVEQGRSPLSPTKAPQEQEQIEGESNITQKHSPLYKKLMEMGSEVNGSGSKFLVNTDTSVQTHQNLYTNIPIAMMRRFMQEFKCGSHSELVELPQWMKSESETERNRHRFFSSLCKPSLKSRRQYQ